jgi:hypothetical protein
LLALTLVGCGDDDPVGPTPDTVPPRVVSVTPADGAQLVATDVVITVTFSEAINPATADSAAFDIEPAVGLGISYADKVVTLTPALLLLADTTYTVTVTGIRDAAGNALSAPFVWEFSTSTVALVSPINNAVVGDSVTLEIATTGGGVAYVEFFTDMSQPASAVDSSAPFRYEFDATSWEVGSEHHVGAKAYDSLGALLLRDSVTVHYLWRLLLEDDQFEGSSIIVARDIWKVFVRSSDSLLEFRMETSAPWTHYKDTLAGINIALFLDTDQNAATGKRKVAGNTININDIGAEVRLIVGASGDSLSTYGPGGDSQILSQGLVDYVNIAPNSTSFEVGVRMARIGSPQVFDFVASARHYSTNGAVSAYLWDWAPNDDEGHATYVVDRSFQTSQMRAASPASRQSERSDAVSTSANPFD